MLWGPGRGCTGGGNLQSCRQEAWKYNLLILCIKDYRMGVYDVYLCIFSKIQFYLRLLLITARAQMFRLPSWFRWTEAKARPWENQKSKKSKIKNQTEAKARPWENQLGLSLGSIVELILITLVKAPRLTVFSSSVFIWIMLYNSHWSMIIFLSSSPCSSVSSPAEAFPWQSKADKQIRQSAQCWCIQTSRRPFKYWYHIWKLISNLIIDIIFENWYQLYIKPIKVYFPPSNLRRAPC